MNSAAQTARETACFSLEEAAKLARVSPDYLRRVERHGGAPYVLACRLSRIYGDVPIDLFLRTEPKEGGKRRSISAIGSLSPARRHTKQATTATATVTKTNTAAAS